MKIIYDHQIFSRQKYGGISRYFHEISNRIPELRGDDVEIFAPLHVNAYGKNSNKPSLNGIRLGKFPGSAIAFGLANAVAGNIFVRSRKNVAIFHETYYSTIDYAPSSAKRIITVYDMIHELFPGSFSKADRTRWIKKSAVLRADHVICISECTRRDLIRLTDIPVEKTSVVYLGQSLTESHDSNAALPNFPKPYLLYVGKRHGYKNFECLIAAYGQSTSLKREFSIVCFGGGQLTIDESSIMRRIGLRPADVVCLAGDDSMLAGLYSSASALIYPSLYEGFGIPPLEAMARGCPVICTNTSSLPEVVGGAAELFDPRSQDALRDAIERVVNSSTNSRRLIALGYERIKTFSWDKCAQNTLNEYNRVLER